MKNIINKISGLKWLALAAFVLLTPFTILAQPKTSELSNPLAITLIVIIIALLIVIAVLANVVLHAAKTNLHRFIEEKSKNASKIVSVIILMLVSTYTFAAAAPDSTASAGAVIAESSSIAGLSSTSFYILLSVIALEVIILLVLLNNVKLLLKKETTALQGTPEAETVQTPFTSWWEKFNSFKPIKEEAQIDLGHNYDGIRELDNKLPGWWLYGFYFTIFFAGIYLYRYHVAHSAPLSHEELKIAIEKAEVEKQEYLKKAGDIVTENNAVLLTDAADLAEGKKIFTTICAACHRADGGGQIGPNLTDDYWIHGGTIKDIFHTIQNGVPIEKSFTKSVMLPMGGGSFNGKQIERIASYVISLHGSNPPGGLPPQGTLVTASKAGADSAKAKTDSTAAKK